MKINYIIDPKVRGIVNIHTAGQLNTEEIFPLFQSILKLNGATAVKKGIIYEIVPFGEAKKLYTPPTTFRESGKIQPEEKYTIQIITLKYIPVNEVSKMIKPFLSDGADIIEHPLHNILIIGDVASNVKKSLDIIELFDQDIFADMRVRIYPIINADVNEIAKEMERIFSSFEINLKSGRGVGITFTPIQRINSLLVVSSIPGISAKVEQWLKELDKIPAEGTKLSVFVYYVQNGKAKDLGNLKNVPFFPKKTAKTTLSIMEGQTIVIEGLIEESKGRSSSGVPFLSKTPILGALFGYKTHDDHKTETVLLLTPHVITDLEESNQVTREFREKLQTIKKELEIKKEKEKKE
ncbi:MAG: hypothetical protein KKH04_07205 [Proteobacteria bacterium]|nr:hypothetical protein [Pseudomonadota bacterium]